MPIELKTEPRTVIGKKVKTLRKKGLVPAELYGHGVENKHLQIKQKDFETVYKEAGEHTIIRIQTEEGKVPIIISEVQVHPISGEFFNVDLRQIRMDEKLQTHIPIELTGTAPGTKKGLMLVTVMDELEIEALPTDLPNKIEVAVDSLKEDGDTIHVGDIALPKGVEALVEPQTVIATISEPKKEKIEEEAPAPTEKEEPKEEASPEKEA